MRSRLWWIGPKDLIGRSHSDREKVYWLERRRSNLVTTVVMCLFDALFLNLRIRLVNHVAGMYLLCPKCAIRSRHHPFCPEGHYLQDSHSCHISGGRL